MAKDVVSKILDIDFVPEDKSQEVVKTKAEEPKQVEIIDANPALHDKDPDEEDFELVRKTLRNLLVQGNKKLDEMGELSNELETARGYEVYSSMMEKMSGLAKDLYDLHKKKKDLKEEEPSKKSNAPSVNVDKAVFVGTTADLLKQIKDKKKADNEDV